MTPINIDFFELGKQLMSTPTPSPVRVAVDKALFAVARDSSQRTQNADAIATMEAASIGAHTGILALLEHLEAFGRDADLEVARLLTAAREETA